MPGYYTLEWRDGRKEDLYGHRGYYYVFSDRTILSFLPDPAWCRHCRQIRLCEHLREQAVIEQELRDLADPDSKRFSEIVRGMGPGFAVKWRHRLEVELRHAVLRTTPPSCLHCGHREVAYFVEDQWAPHPGTGDDVHFSNTGMCSTDFAKKFYDVDCNPLHLSESEKTELREAIRQNRAF